MIPSRPLLTVAAAWLALLLAQPALAGPPTEQLRVGIDQVIKILENPELKLEEKSRERRQAIRTVTDRVFDWPEMARRSLGPHWRGRTESERQEFVNLFRGLLERAYITKIERYSGEAINYVEESVNGDVANVRTTMMGKQGHDLSIDYWMMRRGDRWLIFDVLVDDVSLVRNYRTQFNEIIRASSYQSLLEKIRTKQ